MTQFCYEEPRAKKYFPFFPPFLLISTSFLVRPRPDHIVDIALPSKVYTEIHKMFLINL